MERQSSNHLSERRPVPKLIQTRVAAAVENRGIVATSERLKIDSRTLARAAQGGLLNTRPRLMLLEAANMGVI